jgi:hypothetical protein
MIINASSEPRTLKTVRLDCGFVVVGGGLAGVCAAITAARQGIKVVLIQDRPVLGGNSSSEVRLWALGATSHMGNNNRWAREGGVIDEIFVENTYRNPEGNPHFYDAVLLDKVISEPNITLLLNTAVFEVKKLDNDTVGSVRAFCGQNETMTEVHAPLFCDASGDGIVGYLAGAAYRVGAESKSDLDEAFSSPKEYGELLGHSIFLYSKNTGKPVKFIPPSYALKDISKIPRHTSIGANDTGCQFWWLEYGGRLDTIHDTESIKWELWKVVYGVWDYIKNSGKFPEAENLTLEWVGSIPGKRESRRFEGDTIITQMDLVEQRRHEDAVSFGGWAMDLHPADGVYSDKPGCTQWHSKGVYQIPYRSMYSRNVRNLFLAGRVVSASHVAFGSTRVMATCGHSAQAVGMAAAICWKNNLVPRDLTAPAKMRDLQRRLLGMGQYIPGLVVKDDQDLAQTARIEASGSFALDELKPGAKTVALESARAMLVPVAAGKMPRVTFRFNAEKDAEIELQLRTSEREGNFTPDVTLATRKVKVAAGMDRTATVDFEFEIGKPQYVFVCVMPSAGVSVQLSEFRVTGVLSLVHGANKKVAKSAVQTPPPGIGVDTFEFWIPERRPAGQNLAVAFDPPIRVFGPENVVNGLTRPMIQPNAWVAAVTDPAPKMTLSWKTPQTLSRLELSFDTDFDHAMECVQWGHHDRAMPFCVKHYRILDAQGRVLAECLDNHQTRNVIALPVPVVTDRLVVECLETHGGVPAALFEIRCY